MKEVWKFEACANIEADDACGIAAEKYRGVYNKVTIASPDKDLFQIPECWFFDYYKRATVYCTKSTAVYKFCKQLILGDSTDNIPGVMGAGKAAADAEILAIQELGIVEFDNAMEHIEDYYQVWYTEVMLEKQRKKQEAEYLKQYKVDNDLRRLTKQLKSDALKGFFMDKSMIWDKFQVKTYFKEQYSLVKLLETEAEGLKHGFTMTEPLIDSRVDWDNIEIFHSELELMEDEQIFDDDLDEIL